METKAETRRYQELGAKVVELACADYIDALIVKRNGYISEQQYMDRLWRKVIEYGKKRYVWKDRTGMHHTKNGVNALKCKDLKRLLNGRANSDTADAEIRACEEFFHSALFALSMPNTDPDGLIRILKMKAMNGERMSTGYPSKY